VAAGSLMESGSRQRPSPREPFCRSARLKPMTKRWVPLLAVVALLVAGCGSGGGSRAADGATPTPTDVGSPVPRPTGPPWPAFDTDDYSYTLRITCFCPDAGQPLRVTVRDGKAVAAVFIHGGRGHAAGDDAGHWNRVSIADVIDAANDERAYRVRVRWPEGQAYPSSVYVDLNANGADDEISYSVRDVTPA
jgi:uncharacterized protein DUF6174